MLKDETCAGGPSLLTELALVEDDLSKCLILIAKLREQDLVNEKESLQTKTFILSEEDPVKLSFMVRSFESS